MDTKKELKEKHYSAIPVMVIRGANILGALRVPKAGPIFV